MGKAPNNANIFDLEDKIRFEEFAPSLQRRLETIRTDIEQAWGNGAFSKKFRKYGKLSSDKTKIDQIYDSDSINADRDSGDTWNITGLWKAVETIWGGSNSLFTPPKGTASKGIKPIWDKLNNHEGRISDLEGDVDDLMNPSKGYTPPSISTGGGSGWGNSSGGVNIGGTSGLIIQYGTLLTIKGNKPLYHLTYPKPFTQDGYCIVGNDVGEVENSIWSIGFEHKTKTGCDILVRLGNCTDGTVLVAWIAIGK